MSSIILGAFADLRKAAIIFVMSVRLSEENNSAPTGRIVMTFFGNLSEKNASFIKI